MKRCGNIFPMVCSMPNLMLAHQRARRGKSHYKEVRMVDGNPEMYLSRIQLMLETGEFTTSQYASMRRFESGKERMIHKLPYFPDRIVHHAIVQVVADVWHKTLIRDSYACIPGRGIHDGVRRLQQALSDDPGGTDYCLKMDVRQFYPSLNHDVLKKIIRLKIKDKNLLGLIDEIIDSFSPGVPIGNYLSQFFGNLYLSGYDHWMKEVSGARYYYRYCDDVVVLDGSKERLHDLRIKTEQYWRDNLALEQKNNWQVFPVDSRGVDFLGYRFFHGYTLLRKSITKNFKHRVRIVKSQYKQMTPTSVVSSVMSYNGWMGHANCHNLRASIFDDDLRCIVALAAGAGGFKNPLKNEGVCATFKKAFF